MLDVLKIIVPSIVSVITLIVIWLVSSKNVDKQIQANKENFEQRFKVDLKKETLNIKWTKYFELFSYISVKLQKWIHQLDLLVLNDEEFEKTKWFLPREIQDILHECSDFSMAHISNPVFQKDYDRLSEEEQKLNLKLLGEQLALIEKMESSFKIYLDSLYD